MERPPSILSYGHNVIYEIPAAMTYLMGSGDPGELSDNERKGTSCMRTNTLQPRYPLRQDFEDQERSAEQAQLR